MGTVNCSCGESITLDTTVRGRGEDPGCSGRTRQMPLVFQRAFPVCPVCRKATMYMEYNDSQLYLQLLYYQHLFDVQQSLDRTAGDEKENLSRCLKVEVEQKSVLMGYAQLKGHVDSFMRQNKFSVPLNKVLRTALRQGVKKLRSGF